MSNSDSTAIVLLVDDQMMVTEGIRRMLVDESDIIFHYCNDPNQALEKAIALQPTVILQDLIMPDIDGYALVDAYRNNEKTKISRSLYCQRKKTRKIKAWHLRGVQMIIL